MLLLKYKFVISKSRSDTLEKFGYFRGQNYSFSIGDYIVNGFIGTIDLEIDNLNESDQVSSER